MRVPNKGAIGIGSVSQSLCPIKSITYLDSDKMPHKNGGLGYSAVLHTLPFGSLNRWICGFALSGYALM